MPGDLSVDLTVPPADAARIAEALGVDPGDDPITAVAEQLKGIARAAFAEYMLYVSGSRVPGGIRDLRELRLQLLAQHMPAGLPTDPQVSKLFHLTSAQARNLIAGARARYPAELGRVLDGAAEQALRDGTKGDDDDTLRITATASLAAYLRDVVSSTSSAQEPTRLSDASNRYNVTRSAVEVLCGRLGIDMSEIDLPEK